MEIWSRWSGMYVALRTDVIRVPSFTTSNCTQRPLRFCSAFIAWAFRARGKKAEPIMLAIAAVTLSTMHQSSLGSLFLLMPTKLAPQWWSPVMPISFFLSSIAAGTALVILVEMWIAKAWNRQLRLTQLASLGKITFWSLLVYLAFRLGDLACGEVRQARFQEDSVRFLQSRSSSEASFPWHYLGATAPATPADTFRRGTADCVGRGFQPRQCCPVGHGS